MADVSDSEISTAYEEVRSNKTDTNWLLLDYEGPKSDKLKLTATGKGGLEELKTHLSDANASFAYVRVSYKNDEESQREKFFLVIWIGNGVKVMRRGKISVHSADVKTVLRTFSIEVAAKDKDDLDEGPIIARLRKAGGASYDGV